jgi:hypothetical protein
MGNSANNKIGAITAVWLTSVFHYESFELGEFFEFYFNKQTKSPAYLLFHPSVFLVFFSVIQYRYVTLDASRRANTRGHVMFFSSQQFSFEALDHLRSTVP